MDFLNSLSSDEECRMRDLIFIHFPDLFLSFVYNGKKKKHSTMLKAYMRDPYVHKFVKHLIQHSSTLLKPLVEILTSTAPDHKNNVRRKKKRKNK